MARSVQERREFRRMHVRNHVSGTAVRPRLSVYRSLRHIHAQLIDDERGVTLVAASSREKSVSPVGKTCTVECAGRVGTLLAQRAIEKKITAAVFDRGPFRYHGQVKAVGEGARNGGLKF